MSKVLAIGRRREKVVWKKYLARELWFGQVLHHEVQQFIFCEKNADSQYYQRILNENYLPFHQQGFILMQDNATPHNQH